MDYTNINNLWYDALFNIGLSGHKLKSRVGSCKEIIGFQATLTHPIYNILFVPQRKFSLSYACAEMLWYLSGTDKIDMIQNYAPQYEKFAENGVAYGAYGARWSKNPGFMQEKDLTIKEITMSGFGHDTDLEPFKNQLTALIQLLKIDPNTRQAILTMWDSGDLIHTILKDHKDLPCTLSLIFFVRNNKLHLVTTMRSNDAWLGLPYDVFCFTTLQRIIAVELGLGLGTYIHQAGSEHIYSRNQEKIDQILRAPCPLYPHPIAWKRTKSKYNLEWNIEQALEMEKEIRKIMTLGMSCEAGEKVLTGKIIAEQEIKKNEDWEKIDPIFKDLVLGAATKWTHIPNKWFDNPLYANCQRYEKENDN